MTVSSVRQRFWEDTRRTEATMKLSGTLGSRRDQIQVLAIDDEPAVRCLLAEALTASGYFVYLADGTNSVESLRARRYDMIIADLRMPGNDGLQILALAKETSPDAGLVMITGYPSEQSLQVCRELGVARYLVKPFAIGEIRQVARNVIRSKRKGKEDLIRAD